MKKKNRKIVVFSNEAKPAGILKPTEAKFDLAVGLFQRGRLEEARILLNELLSVDAKNSESLYLSALIANEEGLTQDAINYLEIALNIDPNNLKYIYTLGDIYYANNYLKEGVNLFESITTINPKDYNGYYNLAAFQQKQMQYEKSLESYRKVLELDENNVNAIYNIGNILIDVKDYLNAIEYFKRVVEIQPHSDDAFNNLGFIHMELGDLEGAIKYLNKTISIDPNNFSTLNNLGKVYEKKFLYSEALEYFDAAIRLKPDYSEAYSNRGVILHEFKRFEEALIDFDKAIFLKPNSAEFYSNRGNTLKEIMCFDEALASYGRAIEIKPDFAEAYSNRGVLSDWLLNHEEAILNYDKAIAVQPSYADAYLNKSHNLLLTGDFTNGWNLYEWRWKVDKLKLLNKLDTKIPYLKRQNTNGQSKIFLWAEQGIGDEIFYFGMLKNFTMTKSKITVSADPRLHSLFARSMPEIELINTKIVSTLNIENLFDYQAPIGDIGYLYEVDKAIKNKTARDFLQINQSRCVDIKSKNPFLSDKFVCGISWKSTNKDIGILKSLNLIDLSPILSIENIVFVSLQYGSTKDEIKFVEENIGIKIHTIDGLDILNDIDGLVSLISLCDLVVTTSNITAHLTGAIGKKGMVLIPFSKGKIWYWHSGVGQSLWYPSLELVSQSQMNDWTEPINKCREWVLGQLT